MHDAISSRSRSISASAACSISCNAAASSGRTVGAVNTRAACCVVANRSQ